MCGGDAAFLSNYFDHLIYFLPTNVLMVASFCYSHEIFTGLPNEATFTAGGKNICVSDNHLSASFVRLANNLIGYL